MDSYKNIKILKNAESKVIAEYIAALKGEKVAVLSRVHVLLEKISSELTALDIAHTYIGRNVALIHSESFVRFHAFLKLAVNEHDNFAFLLVKDIIGLSPVEYAEIRLKAAQEGVSHYLAYIETVIDLSVFKFLQTTLCGAATRINACFPDLSPEALAFIVKWKSENAGEIREYLDWLATYDIQEEIKDDDPSDITLMTIHAAKGLEWPVVIVAGCNEGILPSSQAIKGEGIEAERRLMYVAMTRAQDQLILTVRPEKSEVHGKTYESPISRFVKEIA